MLSRRYGLQSHHDRGGTEKKFVKENDHSFIYSMVIDLIPGFSKREWVTRILWRWETDKK